MITRKNGGRGRDLLVTLFDQLFENAGTGAKAGLNLRQSMLSISLPDEKVACALQQRQERNQEKQQPASKTAESKFQR
ncbi:MAG: hypothetical protein WBG13_23730 [Pseudolabrys sp.]